MQFTPTHTHTRDALLNDELCRTYQAKSGNHYRISKIPAISKILISKLEKQSIPNFGKLKSIYCFIFSPSLN